MNTFRFRYECANDAGEREVLDPVTITTIGGRIIANAAMKAHVRHHGGRIVACPSCSEEPLLVGEKECEACALLDFGEVSIEMGAAS